MNASRHLPTSAEVDRRLRIVAELRNLCLSLGRARRMDGNPERQPCKPEAGPRTGAGPAS